MLFLYRAHINLDVPMYLLFPFLLAHGVLACPFCCSLLCWQHCIKKLKQELGVQEQMIQESAVNNGPFPCQTPEPQFCPIIPGRILKFFLASKRFLYSFPFTMATDKCFWLKVTPKAKLISLDVSSFLKLRVINLHSLSSSSKPPN